jgi:secreted protein with Ig-like and vWFA domain
MSLRLTYTGALDTKLAQARTAGSDFVGVDNLAAITTGLSAAAAKGQKKFTLNYPVSYQPADLRLLGPLWEAFKSGVEQGLAAQDIMGNEVVVKLNTSDQLSTSIDLSFSF